MFLAHTHGGLEARNCETERLTAHLFVHLQGALKPDLYSRILPAEGSLDVTSVPEYEPVSD